MDSFIYGSVVLLALIAVTALGLRLVPGIGSRVLSEEGPSRLAALDGLRGMLALGVMLHHAVIARIYYATGKWGEPPSHFDNLAGQCAVALFFMISAYLFWGRVVRTCGALDWSAFYQGRLRRLFPMYAAAVGFLLLIVFAESGWTLQVSPFALVGQVLRWFSFALLDLKDINGLKDTFTRETVLWTLRWEWLLYLALPFAAVFHARPRRFVFLGAVLAISVLIPEAGIIAFFVLGALAVDLEPLLRGWVASALDWLAVGALVFMTVTYHSVYQPVPVLLLLPVFLCALRGRGPWALLRWRPLRFLGHISYSVYLLHNPVIAVVSALGPGREAFGAMSTAEASAVIFGMGLVTLLCSAATFLLIEQRFMHAPPERAPASGPAVQAA